MKTKLYHKNFILVVIGQMISLFGNAMLRFALPLYLLQEQEASLFGIVHAVSLLPLIFMTLFGGIFADRKNKKNMMIFLDSITGVLLLLFLQFYEKQSIFVTILTMICLSAIMGLYQPVVHASIPLILDRGSLIQGNAIISSVSALANLVAPILGGVLFAISGIYQIVFLSMICFFISALLECWIDIPQTMQANGVSFWKSAHLDWKESIHFLWHEKKEIVQQIKVISYLNLLVSSLLMIGMPLFLVKRLEVSEEVYGFAMGIFAFSGLAGGILAGVCKPSIKKLPVLCKWIAGTIVPIAISSMLFSSKTESFLFLLLGSCGVMCLATVISILIMSEIQTEIPEHLTGKIMSFILALSLFAQPIGQIFYGIVFEFAQGYESVIILTVAGMIYIMGILQNKKMASVKNEAGV